MQAVEQVFPKIPLGDLFEGVFVGRADHPDIHRFQGTAADLLETAGLDETQQFGLQVDIHLAYFIEEKSAAVGLFGGPLPFGHGAGESPFRVPEDFAFHQVLGNRPAVDGDERLVGARALPVDSFGTDFLAGAAVAGNENGGFAGSGAVDNTVDRLHGQRRPDKAAVGIAVEIVFIDFDDLGQPQMFQGVVEGDTEALGVERLDDEIKGAQAHGLDGRVDRAVGGDDNNRRRIIAFRNLPQDIQAIHVRQHQVKQDCYRVPFSQRLVGLGSGFHMHNFVGFIAQVFDVGPGQGQSILDQ